MKRDAISAAMSYSIEELGARDIHVTFSYIPYEHFQCTRAFRDGFTYLEYLEVLRDVILPIGSAALQRVRRILCTKAEYRLPMHRWQLPFSSSATSDVSPPEILLATIAHFRRDMAIVLTNLIPGERGASSCTFQWGPMRCRRF